MSCLKSVVEPDCLSATTLGVEESTRIFDQMCSHGNVHIIVAQERLTETIVGALTIVIVPNLTYGGRPWSLNRECGCKEGGGEARESASSNGLRVDLAKDRHCYKTQLLSGANDNQVGFYRSAGFDDANSRGFKRYLLTGEHRNPSGFLSRFLHWLWAGPRRFPRKNRFGPGRDA